LLFKLLTLCVFEPSFGGLGTTYDVHLGLIGKLVVDFLLVLIELFLLSVMAEVLRAKIENRPVAREWVSICQIFTQKGTSPTNHFCTDWLHGLSDHLTFLLCSTVVLV